MTQNPRHRRAISKRKNGTRRIKDYRNYRLRFGLIDSSPAPLNATETAGAKYVAGFDGLAPSPDLDNIPETDRPRIGGFFDGYPPAFLQLAENWFLVTAGLCRGSVDFDKAAAEVGLEFGDLVFIPANVQIGVEAYGSFGDPEFGALTFPPASVQIECLWRPARLDLQTIRTPRRQSGRCDG
ncbi:uncharacterized protein JCM15063_006081 [Sporobolomyces koalae]|uniref:uncharacterized protein n=1 Tax=Sporobolomyces koalae TaxID=500713 RepID=UPI00317F05F6